MKSTDIIEQKTLGLTEKTLENTEAAIAARFEDAIAASIMVLNNKDIINSLSIDPNSYDLGKLIDNKTLMTRFLRGLEEGQKIFKLRLYVNDAYMFSIERINIFPISNISNENWYPAVTKEYNKIHWIYTKQKYTDRPEMYDALSAVRVLTSYKSIGEPLGILFVEIPIDTIEEILQKNNISEDSVLFLVNNAKDIVISSNSQLIDDKYKDIQNEIDFEPDNVQWNKMHWAGQTVYVGKQNVDSSGWNLVTVIPATDLMMPGAVLRAYSILLTLLVAVIAYFLAFFTVLFMIKRLRLLNESIIKAQNGEINIDITTDKNDEIGGLEKSFNSMLSHIRVLLNEKYVLGQEIKSAELKALQAQINPHFLYNTLDLIYWRAQKHNAADIQLMVSALAQFYKLSLSNGKDVVTIADEIAHAEIYVTIQNERFKNIEFETDVEPGVLDNSILKLILQPIVENCILHGLRPKIEKRGVISLYAYEEGDDVVLKVTDDGVGMSRDKMEKLLTDHISSDEHGYSIKNVNERLKLSYGERYGLTYSSVLGEGTVVEIRIPADRQEVY